MRQQQLLAAIVPPSAGQHLEAVEAHAVAGCCEGLLVARQATTARQLHGDFLPAGPQRQLPLSILQVPGSRQLRESSI